MSNRDTFNHGMNTNDQILLVSASYDHTIRFWQVKTGLCTHTLQHTDSQVNALCFTPNRQMLAAAGYQHIRLYDLNTADPNPIINYENISKNVTAVSFHREQRWMLTGGEDCSARIWDLRIPPNNNLQCSRIFQVSWPVNTAVLHPDQVQVLVGDQGGNIYLWDLRTDHNDQYNPEPHGNISIQHLDVDPRGQWLGAVSNKGVAYLWSLRGDSQVQSSSLEAHKRLSPHNRYGLKCRFSPNCSLFATTSADQSVVVHSASQDWMPIAKLVCDQQRWVWDCAFSNDSSYLVTCSSDSALRLWHIPSQKVVREFQGHQKAVTALAFLDGIPLSP